MPAHPPTPARHAPPARPAAPPVLAARPPPPAVRAAPRAARSCTPRAAAPAPAGAHGQPRPPPARRQARGRGRGAGRSAQELGGRRGSGARRPQDKRNINEAGTNARTRLQRALVLVHLPLQAAQLLAVAGNLRVDGGQAHGQAVIHSLLAPLQPGKDQSGGGAGRGRGRERCGHGPRHQVARALCVAAGAGRLAATTPQAPASPTAHPPASPTHRNFSLKGVDGRPAGGERQARVVRLPHLDLCRPGSAAGAAGKVQRRA